MNVGGALLWLDLILPRNKTSWKWEKFGGESPHSDADLENLGGIADTEDEDDVGVDDSEDFSSWTTWNSSGALKKEIKNHFIVIYSWTLIGQMSNQS